jgi:RimJ/RimL family protein N-acetyltransferase
MTIQSTRLRLTGFTDRHLQETYVSWLNDPLLMRYSEQRLSKHTLESCRQYMRSFEGTPNYFWAIEAIASGSHIGNLNAYVDAHNKTADLGLLIGAGSAASQGMGTEAWIAACDFLFRHRNVRKVTAGTVVANLPMIRVCEKSGMQSDGVRRAQIIIGQEALDLMHFCIFRDDWLNQHAEPLVRVEM